MELKHCRFPELSSDFIDNLNEALQMWNKYQSSQKYGIVAIASIGKYYFERRNDGTTKMYHKESGIKVYDDIELHHHKFPELFADFIDKLNEVIEESWDYWLSSPQFGVVAIGRAGNYEFLRRLDGTTKVINDKTKKILYDDGKDCDFIRCYYK